MSPVGTAEVGINLAWDTPWGKFVSHRRRTQ